MNQDSLKPGSTENDYDVTSTALEFFVNKDGKIQFLSTCSLPDLAIFQVECYSTLLDVFQIESHTLLVTQESMLHTC